MRRFAIPLLALCAFAVAASARPTKPPFPALPDEGAWGKLPPQKKPVLPEWARVLAGSLPKTTAKMLELDYFHRAKNPLDPKLAAALRGTVAEALDSEYGKAAARADLARVPPLKEGQYSDLRGGLLAMRFAKKLTLAGHAITDDEFAEVLKHFGPEQTTAIVHTVAYANFHNRLVLALGVKGESPVAPPIDVAFDLAAATGVAPARPPWDDLKAVTADGPAVRVEWSKGGFDQLNATMEKQKERKLRIPLPDKATLDKLPPRERESAQRILWNTVSSGYQPEMTRAWFAPLAAFYEEAKPDRVFTNSAFWVVTRTNDCFY